MGSGRGCVRPETRFRWADPDGFSAASEAVAQRRTEAEDEGETESATDPVDLEFEWYRLCHGCGDLKWFSGLICNDCQERHGV